MTIQPALSRETLRDARDAAHGLALLRGVLDDAPGRAVLALLAALTMSAPDAAAVADAYTAAFRALAVAANDDPLDGLPDAWQSHLVARLLDDDDPWSAQAETARARGVRSPESTAGAIAPGLRAAARQELRALRLLYDLDATALWDSARDAVAESMPALRDAWVPWRDLTPPLFAHNNLDPRRAMARRLACVDDWADLTDELAAHWSRHGTGMLARYRVLRWEGRGAHGSGGAGLRPVAHPDPARLDGLIGYEREQKALASNIERFLAGLPAQHALLYGPPGTGKSSTVKALATYYAPHGLRLVELRKGDSEDLPAIAAAVRGRAPHFLIYVDDLSFEEHETAYKALKALLEGTAEARPDNMILYATTNRRNLVRETFAERGAPGDDPHGRDTMGEKISLAARFGLRVTFPAPDQERYVAIATALARSRGLTSQDMPDDELRRRALLWERQHPGRSGRTARQFVDDLEAESRSP
jgi:predicted AAA+ superfamily ATPase